MIRDIKYIIKKVIIGFLIGVLLFLFRNSIVSARTLDYWASNIEKTMTYYWMFNLTNNGRVEVPTGEYTMHPNTTENGKWLNVVFNTQPVTLANNGVMHIIAIDERYNPNYVYSLSTYRCTNKRLAYDNVKFEIYLGGSSGAVANRPSNTTIYNETNITEVSNVPSALLPYDYDYCSVTSSYFVPRLSHSYIGIREYASGNQIANVNYNILGYSIQPLGLYNGAVEQSLNSVISNSGIASATSVQQVQNSVNQVKQEIQGMQQKQDQTNQKLDELNETQKDTNDFLKDNSTPGSSDITNVTDKIKNENANVSDLVNMIPNTLRVVVNGFQNGCSGGYSLGSLYGTELILPCINPVEYLGSFMWGVIDSILCLCYLIPFAKFLVNKYNDLTSLKNARFQ